ncbi:MAG: histidine kinase [Eubacteriales bacterium]
MYQYFKKRKIKTKISFIYITVLLISFLLTFSVIYMMNEWYTKQEVGDAGVQTVNALSGNLSFMFDNVTQFSSLLYFDETIQSSLAEITDENIDATIQRNIQKSLINIIISGDYISSVYIFDQYFNSYNSYKVGPILVDTDSIVDTEWYQQMKDAKGNGFFIHKSENILSFPTRENKNYISYIREIGNSDTYEPIATLLVIIDGETIESYFEEVSGTYESQFFIIDGNGDYIIPPSENEEEYLKFVEENSISEEPIQTTINQSKVIVVGKDLDIQDWKLVGSFQTNSMQALAPYYTTTIIVIMFLNIMVVMVCSMWLTKLIFAPLSKVEKHMKLVENGQFVTMEIEENDNEINSLKKVFNHMTHSIETLISTVKEEEKIIAKGELDLLQAQINPHFLYNTLDAVSALALMEDHENCFKMTQALGSFYRNSLNSGMDVISIKDEIQCIKSYMTILNTRYDDQINVYYDIEEGVLEYVMMKLLLQPVIENAVHHGIKQKGGRGMITIKIYKDEEEIIFIITDNGNGMSEERIEKVLRGEVKTGKSGFGLHSLIQRTRLYYGIENPVTIHSELGTGTEITIRILAERRSDIGL